MKHREYTNLLNLRKLKKKADGVLDQRTIQTAVGKCPPRQRIWGISGTVILGMHLATLAEADQHIATLNHIRDMQASEDIVHIEGGHTGVSMWFSGPRQAGDFIAYGCAADHPLHNLPLTALEPPKTLKVRGNPTR